MRERELQRACIVWVKEHWPDVLIVNIHGGGWSAKGFPDLICCVCGLFVAVELKVGDNDMQSDQKLWKKRIEKAGGVHECFRTLEEFQEMIETIENLRRKVNEQHENH